MGLPDPLLLGKAPAPVAANHPRSPMVAALLALLCPGLGHFYCAAIGPALVWSVTPHLALVAMLFVGVLDAPHLHLWLGVGLAAWLALRLAQVAFAWVRAGGLARYTLRPINNPALYVAFFLGTSIFTSLLGLPFRQFVMEPFRLPNASMEPSLTSGDQLFVIKAGPHAQVRRGDVVVFRHGAASFLKRVVALEGDVVELRDDLLFLNHAEQSIVPCTPASVTVEGVTLRCFSEGAHRILRGVASRPNVEPLTVPAGHLFVIGDNRDNSSDSRTFGPVPVADVVGRVAGVWLSLGPNFTLRPERIGLQP